MNLDKIKNAKRVSILTGAGISAESGIPTFRGKDGYWKNFKAEELATPSAFQKNPTLIWEWYDWRRGICASANPNSAHHIVSQMESYYPEFLLITQNVDGLHKRAGSKKIIEIHGNIFTGRCTECRYQFELVDVPLKEIPVKCPKCNSLARPHIVWFGENYDMRVLNDCYAFLSSCDLIFIIGTSGQVSVPVQLGMHAISKGAYSIEINIDESTVTEYVDYFAKGKAGDILPEIWKGVTDNV